MIFNPCPLNSLSLVPIPEDHEVQKRTISLPEKSYFSIRVNMIFGLVHHQIGYPI
jgi:hypothetical protein